MDDDGGRKSSADTQDAGVSCGVSRCAKLFWIRFWPTASEAAPRLRASFEHRTRRRNFKPPITAVDKQPCLRPGLSQATVSIIATATLRAVPRALQHIFRELTRSSRTLFL